MDSPYATAEDSAQVLASGALYRAERLSKPDMLTTDEAAALLRVTRVTINAWIKKGQCLALSGYKRGHKLPRWQFDPCFQASVRAVVEVYGHDGGWAALSFLEAGHGALNGASPLHALLTGTADCERIKQLAIAAAH